MSLNLNLNGKTPVLVTKEIGQEPSGKVVYKYLLPLLSVLMVP